MDTYTHHVYTIFRLRSSLVVIAWLLFCSFHCQASRRGECANCVHSLCPGRPSLESSRECTAGTRERMALFRQGTSCPPFPVYRPQDLTAVFPLPFSPSLSRTNVSVLRTTCAMFSVLSTDPEAVSYGWVPGGPGQRLAYPVPRCRQLGRISLGAAKGDGCLDWRRTAMETCGFIPRDACGGGHIYTYIHTHIYIHICVYVCMYVCRFYMYKSRLFSIFKRMHLCLHLYFY
jgi:hypothetical protein